MEKPKTLEEALARIADLTAPQGKKLCPTCDLLGGVCYLQKVLMHTPQDINLNENTYIGLSAQCELVTPKDGKNEMFDLLDSYLALLSG